MIPYIMYAALILAASFVFYKLLLQRETFFRLNRIVLLSCVVLAFSLPLLRVPQQWSLRKASEIPVVVQTFNNNFDALENEHYKVPLQENISYRQEPPVSQAMTFEDIVDKLKTVAIWLYWMGVIAFAINFLIQLIILLYRVYTKPVVKDGIYRIIEMRGDVAPCSFGNFIFINSEKYDLQTYNQVLLHEKIHVKQKHTLDIVLAELVLIFQWFNPFAWKFRKVVESNLEFLTDNSLLIKNDIEKQSYQLSLFRVAAPHFPLALTSNYNQSLLKKRISMMNAKRSSMHSAWRYLFIVPVMLLFMVLFNETVARVQNKQQPKPIRDTLSTHVNITNELAIGGSWSASVRGSYLQIMFKGSNHASVNSGPFRLDEFIGISTGASEFSIPREAGTVQFTGRLDGKNGSGTYKFIPNKDYAAYFKKEGFYETSDKDLMAYFIVNVKRSFVHMLAQNRYTRLSKNQLLPLSALNVTDAYIKSIKNEGFSNISAHELVAFRELKIDANFIKEVHGSYPNADIQKIIALKSESIDPLSTEENVNANKNADARNKNVDAKNENADARNENVNTNRDRKGKDKQNKNKNKDKTDGSIFMNQPLYFSDGPLDLSQDNVIDYANPAIKMDTFHFNANVATNVNYNSDERSYGGRFNPADIQQFKKFNIGYGYIDALNKMGYGHLSAEEIIGAKLIGLTPTLIQKYNNLGFGILPTSTLRQLKVTGVSPEYISSMQSKGYNFKDIYQYVGLMMTPKLSAIPDHPSPAATKSPPIVTHT